MLQMASVFLLNYSNYGSKNSTIPDGEVIDRTIGIPMAFGAAIGTALVMIMMRRMPNTPSAVIVNAYSVTMFFCGIIYLVIVNYLFHDSSFASGIIVPVNSIDCAWLFCNGMCGVLSQITYTASLKIEEAGVVSLARTFQIGLRLHISSYFPQERTNILDINIGRNFDRIFCFRMRG